MKTYFAKLNIKFTHNQPPNTNKNLIFVPFIIECIGDDEQNNEEFNQSKEVSSLIEEDKFEAALDQLPAINLLLYQLHQHFYYFLFPLSVL